MGGAHFCARLSAFKVLSLFFCNSTHRPGLIARLEISRFAEIFGKDCEVQVTLADSKISNFFKFLYAYLGKLNYYFPASRCYPYCCKKSWIASINPSCVGNALTSPFVPPDILIIFSFLTMSGQF
jgi:hypothetical protein